MAYIAYHFHWSREEIFSLPHKERHRWVQEISTINRKINTSAAPVARPQPQQQAPLPQGATFLPVPGSKGGFRYIDPDVPDWIPPDEEDAS